jgi:predicted transcriptional regulator of viral defense system
MPTDTHTQRVLALAAQRGLLRASHLQELGIACVVLSRLTASGQLERVGRGVYRLPERHGSEHESLATIAVKVPQAVFCLLTALQLSARPRPGLPQAHPQPIQGGWQLANLHP